jgi:uncharacterized membrane protein YfcA
MSIYLPLAEMSLSLPLLLALGFAVGVISGMFGIGGGFIMTPLLIFLGVPPGIAVGTGASQVTATSISSAIGHWQRGNVDAPMGGYLIAGGLIGSALGVQLQALLKSLGQLEIFIALCYVVMLGTIGSLMLIEGLNAVFKRRSTGTAPMRRKGHHNALHKLPFKQRFRASKLYVSVLPLLAIGVLVGWLTAIMGVGGGFLLVPALVYLMRVPTRVTLGTSAFQIIFITIATTLLQSVSNHSVDVLLALPLMLGGVIGAQIGVQLGARLAAEQLRIVLALLVLAVAVRMATFMVIEPESHFTIETISAVAD